VTVPVMQIRIVGVPVAQWLMLMFVRVRLGAVPREGVGVPMMRIMGVGMGVSEIIVRVFVLMVFGQMQPHARCHQRR
jgi:hypothetical protein